MSKSKLLFAAAFIVGMFSVSPAQHCMCGPLYTPLILQPPCFRIYPDGAPCWDIYISEAHMGQFLGPFTPEEVGDALNIRIAGYTACSGFSIMTFPANQYGNFPDTRLWKGFNRSEGMLDDDGGLQYNTARYIQIPCSEDHIDLSIDYYPNSSYHKPFYLYIAERDSKQCPDLGCTQLPAEW